MTALSLVDFERDALDTLTAYCTIPCLSTMFDAAWAQTGHRDWLAHQSVLVGP